MTIGKHPFQSYDVRDFKWSGKRFVLAHFPDAVSEKIPDVRYPGMKYHVTKVVANGVSITASTAPKAWEYMARHMVEKTEATNRYHYNREDYYACHDAVSTLDSHIRELGQLSGYNDMFTEAYVDLLRFRQKHGKTLAV